jgi:hypothetical protein
LNEHVLFSGVTYAATMWTHLPCGRACHVAALFAAVLAVGAVRETFVSLGFGYVSDKLQTSGF